MRKGSISNGHLYTWLLRRNLAGKDTGLMPMASQFTSNGLAILIHERRLTVSYQSQVGAPYINSVTFSSFPIYGFSLQLLNFYSF